MSFILRWLPGLGPAVSALANPWVLLGLLVSYVGVFFYGMHVVNGKFEAYKTAVAVVGKAQEDRTKERIKRDKRLKKDADNAHATEVAALRVDVDSANAALRRLQQRPSGSFLPPVSAGSDMSLAIQPATRDRFDEALQEYYRDIRLAVGSSLQQVEELLGKGTRYAVDLSCGRNWVKEQQQ
jgi:hypothetical protein